MRATQKSFSKKTLHRCRELSVKSLNCRVELSASELRSCKVNNFPRRTILRKAASRRLNQNNVTFFDLHKTSPMRTRMHSGRPARAKRCRSWGAAYSLMRSGRRLFFSTCTTDSTRPGRVEVVDSLELEVNMSTTKPILNASPVGDPGVARAIAAIQTVRRDLQHQIENLTADCQAVARTEQLVICHQFPTSSSSGSRDADTAATMSRDGTGDSAFPKGLRNAICIIADNLPPGFRAAEVLAQLQARGFKFTGDPAAAVRDGLYALCHGKSPRFRISEARKGGKPNLYECV